MGRTGQIVREGGREREIGAKGVVMKGTAQDKIGLLGRGGWLVG